MQRRMSVVDIPRSCPVRIELICSSLNLPLRIVRVHCDRLSLRTRDQNGAKVKNTRTLTEKKYPLYCTPSKSGTLFRANSLFLLIFTFWMVPLTGEDSEHLFEVLAEWEETLKHIPDIEVKLSTSAPKAPGVK